MSSKSLSLRLTSIEPLDHNSKFKAKSTSVGETGGQFLGEKAATRDPFNSKSNIKLFSILSSADTHEKKDLPVKSSDHHHHHHSQIHHHGANKSANLVKIKFPSIKAGKHAKVAEYDRDQASAGNLFASSSFVKSENTFKDTIKS